MFEQGLCGDGAYFMFVFGATLASGVCTACSLRLYLFSVWDCS